MGRLRPLLIWFAVLALTACGEETSPRDRLAAAPEATIREGSAAFTIEADIEMGGERSGMRIRLSGDGVTDFASRRGRMSMDLPGMGSGMTMVFDSSDVYLRLPSMLVEGDARWIRQGAETPGSGTGSDYGGDPIRSWFVLDDIDVDDINGEIYELGPDVVRGTDVRGFAFTVPGETLKPAWGDREDVPEDIEDMGVPVEAWLDGQNRLRQVSLTIDMGAVPRAREERMSDSVATLWEGGLEWLMSAMSGATKLTTRYFDFGTDVQVELPDSSEVRDARQLQEQLLQGPREGG